MKAKHKQRKARHAVDAVQRIEAMIADDFAELRAKDASLDGLRTTLRKLAELNAVRIRQLRELHSAHPVIHRWGS